MPGLIPSLDDPLSPHGKSITASPKANKDQENAMPRKSHAFDASSSPGRESCSSQDSGRKKVGFIGQANFLSPSKPGRCQPIPSSQERNSIRSILKTSPVAPTRSMVKAGTSEISTMIILESALQHLASDSMHSRQDAYSSLLACLGAYGDVPTIQDLKLRIEDLSNFIIRDISARSSQGILGGAETLLLTTKATQLLAAFFFNAEIFQCLPARLCNQVLDNALEILENPQSPKSLVTQYLHILQKQNFHAQILTEVKISRLMKILETLSDRFKGARIFALRLAILQKFLTQRRKAMAACIDSWFDCLLAGLFSQISDLRKRAACFGLAAAFTLGTEKVVTMACMNKLNRQSSEGVKCVDRLIDRLKQMSRRKDDASGIPSAWVIIILFLRGRAQQIERWEHLRPWLQALQPCFHMDDLNIRQQANMAWSRFIFAININEHTHPHMLGLLLRPILAQLEPRNTKAGIEIESIKQTALHSYHALLYYAFRPGTSHHRLDLYWSIYVEDALHRLIGIEHHHTHAYRILATFFNSSRPKKWQAGRVTLPNGIQLDHLPALDTFWLRSRLPNIIDLVCKLMERPATHGSHMTIPPEQSIEEMRSAIIDLWGCLFTSLGQSTKEHVDATKEAPRIGYLICSGLSRMLTIDSFESQACASSWHELLRNLLGMAVTKLGLHSFNHLPDRAPKFVYDAAFTRHVHEYPDQSFEPYLPGFAEYDNAGFVHLLEGAILACHRLPNTLGYLDNLTWCREQLTKTSLDLRKKSEGARIIARLFSRHLGSIQKCGFLKDARDMISEELHKVFSSTSPAMAKPQCISTACELFLASVSLNISNHQVQEHWLSSLLQHASQHLGESATCLMITVPIMQSVQACAETLGSDSLDNKYFKSILKSIRLPSSEEDWTRIVREHQLTTIMSEDSELCDLHQTIGPPIKTICIKSAREACHLLDNGISSDIMMRQEEVRSTLTALRDLVDRCPAVHSVILSYILEALPQWIDYANMLYTEDIVKELASCTSNNQDHLNDFHRIKTVTCTLIAEILKESLLRFDQSAQNVTDVIPNHFELISLAFVSRDESISNVALQHWNLLNSKKLIDWELEDLHPSCAKLSNGSARPFLAGDCLQNVPADMSMVPNRPFDYQNHERASGLEGESQTALGEISSSHIKSSEFTGHSNEGQYEKKTSRILQDSNAVQANDTELDKRRGEPLDRHESESGQILQNEVQKFKETLMQRNDPDDLVGGLAPIRSPPSPLDVRKKLVPKASASPSRNTQARSHVAEQTLESDAVPFGGERIQNTFDVDKSAAGFATRIYGHGEQERFRIQGSKHDSDLMPIGLDSSFQDASNKAIELSTDLSGDHKISSNYEAGLITEGNTSSFSDPAAAQLLAEMHFAHSQASQDSMCSAPNQDHEKHQPLKRKKERPRFEEPMKCRRTSARSTSRVSPSSSDREPSPRDDRHLEEGTTELELGGMDFVSMGDLEEDAHETRIKAGDNAEDSTKIVKDNAVQCNSPRRDSDLRATLTATDQDGDGSDAESSSHAPQRRTSTAQELLHGLQATIHRLQASVLAPEEERSLITLLFQSLQMAHEAGRRYFRS